ncbi:hypothetical protein C8J57DRAFT_249598 [Mycena rebaudengoi]|nr:hypothetical protein C8J57DRAFT_249598 [Mycena rebaudengoi]
MRSRDTGRLVVSTCLVFESVSIAHNLLFPLIRSACYRHGPLLYPSQFPVVHQLFTMTSTLPIFDVIAHRAQLHTTTWYCANPNIVSFHGWRRRDGADLLCELHRGPVDANSPAEGTSCLVVVGVVSDYKFSVAAEGNWVPAYGDMGKCKSYFCLEKPDENGFAEDWDPTMANIRRIDGALCDPTLAVNFRTKDRQDLMLRFSWPMFIPKNGNPPLTNNDAWPVKPQNKPHLTQALLKYDVNPPRLFDVDGTVVPITEANLRMKGALVEVTFQYKHHSIRKGDGMSESFSGEMIQAIILQRPRLRPSIPSALTPLRRVPVTGTAPSGGLAAATLALTAANPVATTGRNASSVTVASQSPSMQTISVLPGPAPLTRTTAAALPQDATVTPHPPQAAPEWNGFYTMDVNYTHNAGASNFVPFAPSPNGDMLPAFQAPPRVPTPATSRRAHSHVAPSPLRYESTYRSPKPTSVLSVEHQAVRPGVFLNSPHKTQGTTPNANLSAPPNPTSTRASTEHTTPVHDDGTSSSSDTETSSGNASSDDSRSYSDSSAGTSDSQGCVNPAATVGNFNFSGAFDSFDGSPTYFASQKDDIHGEQDFSDDAVNCAEKRRAPDDDVDRRVRRNTGGKH